jgi:hypothetical protein
LVSASGSAANVRNAVVRIMERQIRCVFMCALSGFGLRQEHVGQILTWK